MRDVGEVGVIIFSVVNAVVCSPDPSPFTKTFVALAVETGISRKPPAISPFRDCFGCKASSPQILSLARATTHIQ